MTMVWSTFDLLFFLFILCISFTADVLGKSFKVNLASHHVTSITVMTDTDISISQPPTRPASLNDIRYPTSTNSSIASANSPFPVLSSLSSTSSVGSLKIDSADGSIGISTKLPSPKPGKTATQCCELESLWLPTSGLPVAQDDIFNGQTSNITMRKHACPKVTPSPVPTQPNSPLGFEDRIPASLASFARSDFGTDLKPTIIAHDKETQALLDHYRISWGTQYELARGVSSGAWKWEEVRQKIKDLTGDNAHAACQVQTVMRGKPAGSANPSNFYLWYVHRYRSYQLIKCVLFYRKELDREQAAIEENRSRGLGLMGEWKGVPNWYGGQVQQITRLVKDDRSYKLILEPMEKRRSHRFARFYGSRHFLQVRISDDFFRKENEAIRAFFVAKFILCGRVFVPFHSKDGGLYMVESIENWERESQDWCGDQFRKPFRDFINWHNPLEEKKNYSQVHILPPSEFNCVLTCSLI